MTAEDVYLSFLPLAHSLDRTIEEYFFHKGASVGYYHGVCSCRNILLIWICLIIANMSRDTRKLDANRRMTKVLLFSLHTRTHAG